MAKKAKQPKAQPQAQAQLQVSEQVVKAVHQAIIAARTVAIHMFPPISAAILSMRITPRPTPNTPTMGVDRGWRLYWNLEWVKGFCRGELENLSDWDLRTLAGVWVHEVWHLLRLHSERAGNRHHLLWNISGDLEINDDISPDMLPSDALYPSTFELPQSLSAEEYYELLSQQQGGQGGQGGESGDGGDGFPVPVAAPWGDEGEGSGVTGRRASWELSDDDPECPSLSPAQREAVRAETARQIKEALEKGVGNIPSSWQRWADEVLRPKVDWRKELRATIRGKVAEAMRRGYGQNDWNRESRRYGDRRFFFPARRQPVPSICVVIDTSGSMGERELGMALAEVRGILATVGGKITVVSADADVAHVQKIHSHQQVRLIGGGGTDMGRALEWVAENVRPDVCVIITDGETPWGCAKPRFPVIVVLTQQTPTYSQPPQWAKTIVIDK